MVNNGENLVKVVKERPLTERNIRKRKCELIPVLKSLTLTQYR